jgi:hypothetical protein
MTYDGDAKRLKAFNLVHRVLEKKLRFAEVLDEIPASPPKAGAEGSIIAYLASATESTAGITNQEKDSDFRISVILVVRANKGVELEKIKACGAAEKHIMALQNDAEFTTAGLTMIDVETMDRGPLALATYGIEALEPPLGAARLDVLVQFTYTAF